MTQATIKCTNDIVTIHNKREALLVRIINQQIDDLVRYRRENTFGECTANVINRNLADINGQLTALYFMDCTSEYHCITTSDILRASAEANN